MRLLKLSLAVLCAGVLLVHPAWAKNHKVMLHTNKGDIELEVNADRAPKTAENFLSYVREGFYDGTIIHRVIPGFVIQGGGFNPSMEQKQTHAPIENEASNGLANNRYTVSMARTNDPNSATSQFFINLSDNKMLDPSAYSSGYAVFAKVVSGSAVVDEIAAVPTTTAYPHQDVPVVAVIITQAEVLS